MPARMRGMAMSRVATSESVAMTMTEENGLHRIAIRLNNTGLYSGLQLDVNLPDGVTVMSETLGARAEDHELFSNTMANREKNTLRAVPCFITTTYLRIYIQSLMEKSSASFQTGNF